MKFKIICNIQILNVNRGKNYYIGSLYSRTGYCSHNSTIDNTTVNVLNDLYLLFRILHNLNV